MKRKGDEERDGSGRPAAWSFSKQIEMMQKRRWEIDRQESTPEAVEMKKMKEKIEKKEKKKKMKQMLRAVEENTDVETQKVIQIYISLPTSEFLQKWYEIDMLNPECSNGCEFQRKKTKITPTGYERTLKFTSSTHSMPTFGRLNLASVCVGCSIYLFGGFRKPPPKIGTVIAPGLGVNSAFVFDSATNTCRKLPDMLAERVQPKAVLCDNLIFLFGCTRTPTLALKPWGEAFDITTNTWSPVPAPPLRKSIAGPGGIRVNRDKWVQTIVSSCVLLQNPPRILAYMSHSKTKLLCFSIQEWEWSFFTDLSIIDNDPFDDCSPSMLVVRNILYIFFGFSLYFFDFDNPDDGFIQPVLGCLPHVPRPFPPRSTDSPTFPFYLGDGIFCLIWCPTLCESTPSSNMIHCFRFRIDLDFDYEYDPFRCAKFIGCDRFAFHGADGPLYNYCALPRISSTTMID